LKGGAERNKEEEKKGFSNIRGESKRPGIIKVIPNMEGREAKLKMELVGIGGKGGGVFSKGGRRKGGEEYGGLSAYKTCQEKSGSVRAVLCVQGGKRDENLRKNMREKAARNEGKVRSKMWRNLVGWGA